jgi:hypothetical protein
MEFSCLEFEKEGCLELSFALPTSNTRTLEHITGVKRIFVGS